MHDTAFWVLKIRSNKKYWLCVCEPALSLLGAEQLINWPRYLEYLQINYFFCCSHFHLYYDRTGQSWQEVKWEKGGGAGSGKVLESWFELGTHVAQRCNMSAHKAIGTDTNELFSACIIHGERFNLKLTIWTFFHIANILLLPDHVSSALAEIQFIITGK